LQADSGYKVVENAAHIYNLVTEGLKKLQWI